jgi:uncharacterized protein (TIGR02452 family)
MEPVFEIVKIGVEEEPLSTLPPLSASEHNVLVWRDTTERAATFPFKPSVKISHERGKILCAIFPSTHVEVTPEDSLVAGQRLHAAGFNPCILNFADDLDAGGVVDNGNSAQEESLWRRTNLCATQLQSFYPLVQAPAGVQEGIYTPLATVFKGPEPECADLAHPWPAAFIAVPGLKYPRVNHQKMVCLDDMMAMRAKIELIFQAAKEAGHDSLVLGALGCGVWRAPPRQMAEIFRALCAQYNGVFRHITFACLARGPAASGSNYSIFKEVLAAGIHKP